MAMGKDIFGHDGLGWAILDVLNVPRVIVVTFCRTICARQFEFEFK
jgi:hypothetical protein